MPSGLGDEVTASVAVDSGRPLQPFSDPAAQLELLVEQGDLAESRVGHHDPLVASRDADRAEKQALRGVRRTSTRPEPGDSACAGIGDEKIAPVPGSAVRTEQEPLSRLPREHARQSCTPTAGATAEDLQKAKPRNGAFRPCSRDRSRSGP